MTEQLKKILVTIVVPVYNTEKTLERCMNSVLQQTHSNLEIIIVDDGSAESCKIICDDWGKRDQRIKVIHKENAGLGMARNTGIDNATGKYICFCDSDDFIDISMVEKCLLVAEKNNADIVHYGIVNVDKNLKEISRVKASENIKFKENEIIESFLPRMLGGKTADGEKIGLWMSLCTSFISVDFIRNNKWRCESERNIISEDMYSLLELYGSINVVCIVTDCFYYYCENSNSLSRTYRVDRYEKIKEFYLKTTEKCLELGLNKKYIELISRFYFSYVISAVKQICKADETENKKKELLRSISKDELFINLTKDLNKNKVSKMQKIFLLALRYKLLGLVRMMCDAR